MKRRFVDIVAVWLMVAAAGCTARSQPDTGSANLSSSTKPPVDPSAAKPEVEDPAKAVAEIRGALSATG